MSLLRAVVLTRPMLGRPSLWTTSRFVKMPSSAPASKTRVLEFRQNRGISISRSNLKASKVESAESQKEAVWDVWRENISCWWQRYGFWAIFEKAGISHDTTVRFRRKIKKIYYVTGLSTATRAGINLGTVIIFSTYLDQWFKTLRVTPLRVSYWRLHAIELNTFSQVVGHLKKLDCIQESLAELKAELNSLKRQTEAVKCQLQEIERKCKPVKQSKRCSESVVTAYAFPMIIGDLLAQLICKYHNSSNNAKKKKSKKPETWLNFINYCRTAHFAIIGGFLVGPFAKRWNLFWSRRIRRSPPGAYLMRILLLDALLLTPFIVVIYMAGYDFKYFYKTVKAHGSDVGKTFKELNLRYWDAFSDICLFYIATKPAVALLACFVVPCALQAATRRLYSIMFYCILSRAITHFKLGPEITQRKSKAFKKGQHYDGSGGAVCMLCDKISDTLRNAEKKTKK